eukprot:TRINITY_DN106295_c1_g1_i1.p1 TRINITY_DN106295_c1_g1~~TRINITY_DN106295_c1_g1_i1.p1  ORF type:complete len:336 (-),score=40.09 TRINITY_DN106295_c1_g1_i1:2737-3744(-)
MLINSKTYNVPSVANLSTKSPRSPLKNAVAAAPFFSYSANSKHARPTSATAFVPKHETTVKESIDFCVKGKSIPTPFCYTVRPKTALPPKQEPKPKLRKKVPLIKYEKSKKREEESLVFKGMKWRIIKPLDPPLVAIQKLFPPEPILEINHSFKEEKSVFNETNKEEEKPNNTPVTFASKTASELHKLTAQFCVEVEEPVQSQKPVQCVPTKQLKVKKDYTVGEQRSRPRVEIMKNMKKPSRTVISEGIDEEKKMEIKKKVREEVGSWMNKVKEKKERTINYKEDQKTTPLTNQDHDHVGSGMVITETVKKYGAKMSQTNNILRDLLHGSKNYQL